MKKAITWRSHVLHKEGAAHPPGWPMLAPFHGKLYHRGNFIQSNTHKRGDEGKLGVPYITGIVLVLLILSLPQVEEPTSTTKPCCCAD